MDCYIIVFDRKGQEIGRHICYDSFPQKNGNFFINEAVFYFYQLDNVGRIEVIYKYDELPL